MSKPRWCDECGTALLDHERRRCRDCERSYQHRQRARLTSIDAKLASWGEVAGQLSLFEEAS